MSMYIPNEDMKLNETFLGDSNTPDTTLIRTLFQSQLCLNNNKCLWCARLHVFMLVNAVVSETHCGRSSSFNVTTSQSYKATFDHMNILTGGHNTC